MADADPSWNLDSTYECEGELQSTLPPRSRSTWPRSVCSRCHRRKFLPDLGAKFATRGPPCRQLSCRGSVDQPCHHDHELGNVERLRKVRLIAGEERLLAILAAGERSQRDRRNRTMVQIARANRPYE